MDAQSPLLVTFVLPIVLAVIGVVSAVLIVAVPKLLDRRAAPAQPPAPVFDDDPPLDVDGRLDVEVLLQTVARLGEQLDDTKLRAERAERDSLRWERRALACEQGRDGP